MSRTSVLNCSLVLGSTPLLERPAIAAAAGFDLIEFWWPFDSSVPSDSDVDAFVAAVSDAGVCLTGLNFAAGDMSNGDRGIVSWPGRESEFRDSVDIAVGIGKSLATEVFNALYGNVSERVSDHSDIADRNLFYAAAQAERIGAKVVIEPLSGVDRYPLRTARDVVDVIQRIDSDNLGILADFYHLAANGDNIAQVIHQHTNRIGHVQVADFPGRNEPGTGELAIDDLLTSLFENGYSGRVALEYLPTDSGPEEFAWMDKCDSMKW